jgi:hypothetical protein
VTGDCHAGICGSLGAKFPQATRPRYYDPATAQFISVDPALNDTLAPYSYANDNPVTQTDPSGKETLNNPDGCVAYIGNPHWEQSIKPAPNVPSSVKANGAILDCRVKPQYGTIDVWLYKRGEFFDYLQAETWVDSTQKGSQWYRNSKNLWQMWDNHTKVGCTYKPGVNSTFYAQEAASMEEAGKFYYTPNYPAPSGTSNDWEGKNCWTPSNF